MKDLTAPLMIPDCKTQGCTAGEGHLPPCPAPLGDDPPKMDVPPVCTKREGCKLPEGHLPPCFSMCEIHGTAHTVVMTDGGKEERARWCMLCDHEQLARFHWSSVHRDHHLDNDVRKLRARVEYLRDPISAAQIRNPASVGAFARAFVVRALCAAIDHLTKKDTQNDA